uniref:Putative phosphatidate phosphatase n=1 Tax=Ceratitis capitata TaxID=7213 RepID=W8BAN9_CERCA
MKGSNLTTEERRLLRSLLIDLIIFIVLIVPIIIFEFVIEPFHRGFFCSDETIRYPFHKNTITTAILAVIVVGVPAIIIIIVEFTLFHRRGRLQERILLFGFSVPTLLVECVKHALYFTFGGLLTFEATEVGKFTIGRLRPHFISVCQPQLLDGSTCDSPQNQYRYVEKYICLGNGFTLDDVQQSRLSFPSGHSSLSFFALVYMAIYLHYKVTWRGSQLTRHFLQFALVMLAWFTALSRVMDYWHHWSDVLFGGLLGVLMALITARYITKDFGMPRESQRVELPRQDTSTTLNEIIPTSPPYAYGCEDCGSVESLQQQNTGNSKHNHEQFCTKV